MIDLNSLDLSDGGDPRVRLLVSELARAFPEAADIRIVLADAGMNPGYYPLATAKLAWAAIVPDASNRGKLGTLLDTIGEDYPALRNSLYSGIEELGVGAGGESEWYKCPDPFDARFVGPGSSRAVVDRHKLRDSLRRLAAGQCRVLLVTGPRNNVTPAPTGKSHTWVLMDHLQGKGRLVGRNRFVRITTHSWMTVSGNQMARSLVDKLGLNVIHRGDESETSEDPLGSMVDRIIGHYPRDGTVRWIVLDGLDRPAVDDSARDFARRMVALVDEGELPDTRLIVTGLRMPLCRPTGTILREEIPRIDLEVVREFLSAVSVHVGREVSEDAIDAMANHILNAAGNPCNLERLERLSISLVKAQWGGGFSCGPKSLYRTSSV